MKGWSIRSAAKSLIGVTVCLGFLIWILVHHNADRVERGDRFDWSWHMDGAASAIGAAQAALALEPPDIDSARRAALQAQAQSPLSIFALELLAQTAEKAKDKMRAAALHAYIMQRTLRSNSSQFLIMADAVNAGDYTRLAEAMDTVLRYSIPTGPRPPTAMPDSLLSGLATLSSNQKAFNAFVERLKLDPSWRIWFLKKLASDGPLGRLPEAMEALAGQGLDRTAPTDANTLWGLYLDRVIDSGDSRGAFVVWNGLLPPDALANLRLLNNGSFEAPPTGLPFDWRLTPIKGAEIRIVDSPVGDGTSALSVAFAGGKVPFRNVVQTVILDPGRYHLTGMFKSEELKTMRGLSWRVNCMGSDPPIVAGETIRFDGTHDWTNFEADIVIPHTGCSYQRVELGLFSRIVAEQQISGQIWFDKLAITPVTAPAAQSSDPSG